MNSGLIEDITKSPLRQSLYHFTRAANLQSMAHYDALYSAEVLSPDFSNGYRRDKARHTHYGDQAVVINGHLRIAPEVMDPDTTQEQFRRCLDRHVFLWPTRRDCQTMAAMYSRREPYETFAILQFAAFELLFDHFHTVKLSKYDSGSSPRYPHRSSYRKSCSMFLPIERFKAANDRLVPMRPSEIKEILVENKLAPLSEYLQTVYCSELDLVPSIWRAMARPLEIE